jgi:hypothetical protein
MAVATVYQAMNLLAVYIHVQAKYSMALADTLVTSLAMVVP